MAILDEIDSGLDIDALRDVSKAVNALKGINTGVLMVTHYKVGANSVFYISDYTCWTRLECRIL